MAVSRRVRPDVGHFEEMLHSGIWIIGRGDRLLQLTNESALNAVFALRVALES